MKLPFKKKIQKGFSLVELIIYVGVLAFILVALSNIAFIIQGSRLRFSITSDMHAAASRVLSLVNFLVRNSDGFVTDSSGNKCYTDPSTLYLYFATSSLKFLPPGCAGDYETNAIAIKPAGTTGSETPGAQAIAMDGTYIYTAYGNQITKRRKSDLSLEKHFGTLGTLTSAVSIRSLVYDSGNLYIGGQGVLYFAIEKRDAATGTLDTGFDSDGYVESTGGATIHSMKTDSDYLYIAGDDGNDWRIEKRSKISGAYDPNFVHGGVLSLTGNSFRYLWGIDIDSTYMYLIGDYYYHTGGFPGVNHDGSVIVKRTLSTGDVVGGFGSVYGEVYDTFSSAGTAIAVNSSYIYAAGYDSYYDWYVAKVSLTDGSTVLTDYSVIGAALPWSMVIDSNYMFTGGEFFGNVNELLIEKRQLSDLAPCTGDGAPCAADGPFSDSGIGMIIGTLLDTDDVRGMVLDGEYIYSGSDSSGTQKRLRTSGALVPYQYGVQLVCYQNYPSAGRNSSCDVPPLSSHTETFDLVDRSRARVLSGGLVFATTTVGSRQAIETTINVGYDSQALPSNFNLATYTTSSTSAFRKSP